MCIVVPPPRLASAAVVFCGHHGDISGHAQQRGVSRQRLYREADSVVRDLEGLAQQQQRARWQQQVVDLQAHLKQLPAALRHAVVLTAELQAEFAGTAQAEGVSLPTIRRLLAVLLGANTPRVATLGRFTRQAGLRAGPLLAVFDEPARPRARQGAAAEIFFGQKPVLMVVEPESQCWLSGRLSPRRDGEQWAQELQPFPALEHLVRDGGQGLANGLARVNQQRQQRQQEPIRDQLDHFHTLREGRRALRKTQAQAQRACTAAEEADKKGARQHRQGQPRTGYATAAVWKWQKAEQAFHRWENAAQAFEQIRQTLRPFTAQGELNTPPKAFPAVEALLPVLDGEHGDKFKRLLRRPETYTYLERLPSPSKALPVCPEVRKAVVASEGVRQNPQLVQGEGPQPGALRGLLLVWGVLIGSAGSAGHPAVQAFRQLVRNVGWASSCVEGVNSVVRMQQMRHRKMTQGLLDLKRLYWNLRSFRTGGRKKTSPDERLGVALPPDLSWWQLLQLTPDQLRLLLSAQPRAA